MEYSYEDLHCNEEENVNSNNKFSSNYNQKYMEDGEFDIFSYNNQFDILNEKDFTQDQYCNTNVFNCDDFFTI